MTHPCYKSGSETRKLTKERGHSVTKSNFFFFFVCFVVFTRRRIRILNKTNLRNLLSRDYIDVKKCPVLLCTMFERQNDGVQSQDPLLGLRPLRLLHCPGPDPVLVTSCDCELSRVDRTHTRGLTSSSVPVINDLQIHKGSAGSIRLLPYFYPKRSSLFFLRDNIVLL